MVAWDYIVVGGGIAGSALSSRLLGLNPSLRILLVEAGRNTSAIPGIEYANFGSPIGGTYDWGYSTTPQRYLDNRSVPATIGKGLGGGSLINGAWWVRGDEYDYNLWGKTVGDKRWSYDGLLPYMRKTETFFDTKTNPEAHGHSGPIKTQSVTSTNRSYPLRQPLLESWQQLGVHPIPGLDGDAGHPLGVGDAIENRDHGRRQLASLYYPLAGVEVVTDMAVARVLTATTKTSQGDGGVRATGVELANGTRIEGREIVLSAGAYHTPQILMLSGIGPRDVLDEQGIPVVLEQPDIGRHLHDHMFLSTRWQLRDPMAYGGITIESGNPLFQQPQYGLGLAVDFNTVTRLEKEGLAAAIQEDTGRAPGEDHPLLQNRSHICHTLHYSGAGASAIRMISIMLLTEARGFVGLRSSNISDAPVIDSNYLSTTVDRYAARQLVNQTLRLLASDETVLGRDVFAGEISDKPLTPSMSDEEIDAGIRARAYGSFHPAGTASMGKVVDASLRVMGVKGLRVVDTSVFPVPISGNLQVATYATAEQAAVIFHKERRA
ncbi:hypothetical protein MAPG_01875 [Magnaporthiopsis poae ATCC 64411]|uniref:Glucose-methanol-choline oxidoreductase N-terminal domain-containing protein n=1 Tax=Magnaporthiopsis poae (strain ATCC 64411 / 73-15) TaxID=644358 RepID=A0A0C4DPU7_MAGP6|nr:hypothetical protein MAPG_01875 [Magnaporthiopsis poae ATCC 64411]